MLLVGGPGSFERSHCAVGTSRLSAHATWTTFVVPFGATAMSAPSLCDAPPGPPVEIVRGDDHVTPPSVERLKTVGELPRAPWKSVSARYTLPAHGLAAAELRSTSIHGLSVKFPAKPTCPGTANPIAPRSTIDVPW